MRPRRPTPTKPCVLLVEDDPGDQELVRRAVGNNGAVDLHIVETGEDALDYLHRRGAYADGGRAPRPELILLDLNLPGVSGRRVLEETRAHTELGNTPIVVLSTSSDQIDIEESYRLRCNSYVVKPLEAHRFMDALRRVFHYWFEVVTLPDC